MKSRKNLDKIILECLTEVYTKTTPPVDLQEVISSGLGKEQDWFLGYSISEDEFTQILGSYISKYKLRGSDLEYFRVNMYLGPSPRFT